MAERKQRTQAPFGRRLGTVLANEPHGAYRLLSVADPLEVEPQAGQFYMIAAARGWEGGESGRPFLPRAFSFCRIERKARAHPQASDSSLTVEFLLEEVGPGTKRLADLVPGEGMHMTGPLGIGFRPPADQKALLVGGGIGVAPLLAFEQSLRPTVPRCLLGFRTAVHARAGELFGNPLVATDDGTVGTHGSVTKILTDQLADDTDVCVYACGPQALLEEVWSMCTRLGVRAQLALETQMACGFGSCFGCAVATRSGYLRLCLDGPVVDASELSSGFSSVL
jgi:dihydroorotate dehydrogenase electron transfer subunit